MEISTYEGDETFVVNLSNATNATISDDQGQGTISNDDTAPALTIDNVTLAEGNAGPTLATFTVTLTGSTALTTTVDVQTADGTAAAGTDYGAAGPTTLTFLAGETSKTFDVTVNGDTAFETDETFVVNLSNAANATISDDQGQGTITNDDTAPALTINDVTLAEGNAGPTLATFTVTLTGSTALTTTVDVQTADGTAVAGSDYVAAGPTTLTFLAGETSKTFDVAVNGDTTFEADETFVVNLSNAANATISDDQGQGTITNDDTAPALTINDVTLAEGNAGPTLATFTVTLTGNTALTTTVDVQTANGTAAAGTDYVAAGPTTLTFLAGETSKTLDVTVNGDTAFETDETFVVNLSNAVNATIGDGEGLGTITNDDAGVSFSIDDVTQSEGNGGPATFTFTVTLTGITALTTTVDVQTADGTGVAGSDYVAAGPTTLTFLAGETSKTFDVAVNGDTAFEADETFVVNLSNAANATISDDQGQGTITNDDTAPALTINDVTLAEGNSGTTLATFTVTLTGSTALTTTVDVQTADGTAAAGSDYVAAGPTTLTFVAGETSKTFDVTVNGDTAFETDETFVVNLSNAANATISDDQGQGTISNDDTAPALTIDNVTLAEGNAGPTLATFTVTLTGITALTTTVDVQTADGTAAAGSDYVAAGPATLTFLAGETSKTFDVTVNGDTAYEADETFVVNLSNPTAATISDDQGQGTITNDDTAPALTINDVTLAEGNSGPTLATFTVTLTGSTALTTTVDVQTADGTAVAGSDYVAAGPVTLTFLAGETSKTFDVTVNGDTAFEADETFVVNLSNAANATINDDQGQGTITNDDTAPALTINDVTLAEGNGGTTLATFTVTLTGSTALTTTVDAQTADGTAAAGSDYVAAGPATLTFLAGETSKTFDVTVNGDTAFETDETFVVNLSNAVNATIGDGEGLGTITNDDAGVSFSIDDVTQSEGNGGPATFTFTVTLTGITALTTTVDVQTADGTAAAGSDYVAAGPATLTFLAGETSKTFDVTVNGDTAYEADETFVVNLSNPTAATISDEQGQGTITNDDAAPALTINDVTLAEGNSGPTLATFTVTLTGSTALTTTVDVQTADGTAVAGSDYVAAGPATLTFLAGETSKTFDVTVNGDTAFEADETFVVNLSNAANATINDDQGQGTITNDDTTPALTINDVTLAEGNAGPTLATFTVTLTGITALTTTVDVQTADGTAAAGSDYVAAGPATVTFLAGETSKTFDVAVNGDTAFEADETFVVNLSNAVNATIGDGEGLGTITNDDAGVSFSIDDVTQSEGNGGPATFTFTVTLTGITALTTTVDVQTADGTGVAGSDYVAAGPTTLTFLAGETSKTFDVAVNGDTAFEADETFVVNLSNAANATISDDQGQGTITNDDTAPALTINDVTLAEGNSGTTLATFTVTLTGSTALTTTVDVQTADGTAAAGSDYVAAGPTTLTFVAGETSKTFDVTVNGDTAFETDETFVVNLSNAANATISDDQGQGTITNDDAAPALTINDVTLAEGNSGTTLATFTVTLTGITALTTTVDVQTAAGTAAAGGDYVAAGPATLTFLAGETSKTFDVTVNGDTAYEADETFVVNLSNPTAATISDDQGQGTITNDDAAPALTINDVTLAEGNAGPTLATFTVTLTGITALTTTVDVQTADGTAVAGSDYVAAGPATLTFLAGETSKTFDVTVNGDTTFEADETFVVNLSNAANATISDAQGQGTITNDDTAPALTIDNVTLAEGNAGPTLATFTVTLTGSTALTTTVDAQTADGTAVAGSDYVAAGPATLTFLAGETSKTFDVTVNGDTAYETDETFVVNLSNAANATINDDQGQGTITNDDTAPALTINDVTLAEGNSGTTLATFTVTLTGSTALTTTVDVQTADGTAAAGTDYVAAGPATLTFLAGETSKTFDVAVNGDAAFEADETFVVNLSNAVNATIGDGEGLGTITNDDAGVSFSIDDVTQSEGDGGPATFTFTVTLTGITALTTTVDVQTADGTAVAGSDYVAAGPTTLTFLAGETSKTFDVAVNGDTAFEADETFVVNLSNAANATISDDQGQGTITNDDTAPALTINDVTLAEGNGGTTLATFTVTLTGSTALSTTVDAQTADGTAAAGSDYVAAGPTTLTFLAGETSKTFEVTVNGDTAYETDETFVVNLSNAANATISDDQGQGTITNDDTAPALTINDVTLAEGNGGTTLATFTVTLTGSTALSTTVDAQTADGTAAAGSDYVAAGPTTLTFLAGETSKTFEVTVNGDTAYETDETFVVNLSNAANATISDDQGQGTITNDDTAPALTINDVTLAEGNGGTTLATFTVTLTGSTALTTTVDAQTADGTAAAGTDYVAAGPTTLTFLAGETSKTFDVAVNGDAAFEADETFLVNLSNPINATIGDGEGLGTITNDDAGVSFSIDDVTQSEGNGGPATFTFTVTLTGITALTTTVDVQTADGTAVAGSDYVAAGPTTLTFLAGETSKAFDVTVNGDTTYETDQTFFVNLSNPSNAAISDSEGVGTITNDDAPPTFAINDVNVVEGNAGTTIATFTVTKTGVTEVTATVQAATADGTAVAPDDYPALPLTTLTFMPGQMTLTVNFAISTDTIYEADETFFVNLSNPTNATINDPQGQGTITNDDTAPTLTINDVMVSEGSSGITVATFTVTLTGTTALTTTVDMQTANDTAAAGTDYVAAGPTTLTFMPGETSKTFDVTVNGDTTLEANETFTVNLSNATGGATIADGQGQGTITNDDSVSFSINDVTQNEGNSGPSTFTFTVTLTGTTVLPVTVDVETADGTATAGSDYVAAGPATLMFAVGETNKTFDVTVNGDTTLEANETFTVNLSNATGGATIADGQGQGTITNDDSVSFSINDVTQNEGNSGPTTFTFTVTLTGTALVTTTVDVQTSDGTATAGSDYVAAGPAALMFAVGETNKTFDVTVNGDTALEANETFTVNLSNATGGATIADGQGQGTITNDDSVSFSINDVTQNEGNSGPTTFTFTVTLTGTALVTTTVDVQTSDGTATAGSDYVAAGPAALMFAVGETSKTFDVTVNGETTLEANETFTVNLSNATGGATINDDQGLGTITNDDVVSFVIDDVSQAEGNGGTTTFTFTVSLTGAALVTTTVDVQTANDTATAGSDYTAAGPTTLTFAPGVLTQTVSVTVNGDTTYETNETFVVDLSNATGATINDSQGIGTITNDDAAPTFAIDDVTQAEGNAGTTTFTFTVTKTGATELNASVDAQTSNGTATAGTDYMAVALTTLTFLPNESTQTVSVTINGDVVFETDETFVVNLTNATNATINDDQGQGTITNDDAAPALTIDDVTVAEGNSGTTLATFTVTKTGATELSASVDVQTADGTAAAGVDYAAVALTTLTFLPNETTQTISVTINGDTAVEADETFVVNLSNATDATISDNQGQGTITNDDVVSFVIDDVSQAEGNGGTTTFTFTVSLTGAALVTTTVDVQTANDTATAGSDYTAAGPTTLTFAPGVLTQTVAVTVNGDTTYETNETFVVDLSNATGATINDNQGIGTITNDDAAPTFAIDDVTQAEGNAGTTAFTFTVTKTGATELNASVDAQTSNGTATAGTDYMAVALTTLTFLPNESTQTVSVTINGDVVFETDETFVVNLTNATNATINDDQGQGTITNDDAAPALTIDDVTVAEGNSGTTLATFTVTKTGATELSASVDVQTADGTAAAGVDYAAVALATLTFLPNETTQTISVTINGDTAVEADETFVVDLSNSTGATIVDNQGQGTITNDDVVSFVIDDVSQEEGNAGAVTFTFTVTLTGAALVTTTVDVQTADGTATAVSDYVATGPTTLTFLAGETSKTFDVTVNGDTTYEATETFVVNLSNPTGATIVDAQGQGTITNDDAAPVLTIDDVTLGEGNTGMTVATFTVMKSGLTDLSASVDVQTANGTATSGSDYVALSLTTLTFLPNEITQIVSVAVNGDSIFETIETFSVNLSNASDATIADNQGTAVIVDDDAPPTFAINDIMVTEGDGGTTTAVFAVTKAGATELTASVQAATSDGTAAAGSDYDAIALTALTFAPNETTQTISVTINGDATVEADETFFVNLSNPTAATISDDQGQGTILNDDIVSFIIDDVIQSEGNGGTTTFTFTVTLGGTTTLNASVDVQTGNGTATAGSDYVAAGPTTLTFLPGETSKTFDVAVNADTIYEANETFVVNLNNATGATIFDVQGQGTITNDDAPPVLAIDDVAVTEGNAGTTLATFTVSLTGPTALTATVDVQTAAGTAAAGSDYTAGAPTTLIFLAGETIKTFDVTVNGDTAYETDETFVVNLSNASGATVADNQGQGTITNDDSASTLTIDDVTVTEGNAGTTLATFTVTKTGATELTANVDVQTADGTAVAGSDYQAVALTTLTFQPNETTQTVTVAINGDTTVESDETFDVNLSNATNATIADNQGQGTITNDDVVSFVIDDVVQAEGNTGTTTFTFTVSLTAAALGTTSVDVQTAGGTATAGSDYVAAGPTTLTFLAGETIKTFGVTVNADTTYEAHETFFVNLTNAGGGVIADSQGQGTITNDDIAPSFAINDVQVTEGNSGTSTATFTVTKAGATELASSVQVQTSDGTAVAGSDYVAMPLTQLTFAPGESTKTVTVTINGDTGFEPDETFVMTLSNPVNATISDAQALGTILNDDQPNTAPVANDDTATTDLHVPATINVLANDSDDAPLIPSSISIETGPANGSVTVDAITGNVTYTPGLGFYGTDQFTYVIRDGSGEVSNPATVTVTVLHDPTEPLISLVPDPQDPSKTVLVIMGTDGDDIIRVFRLGTSSVIKVIVNGIEQGLFRPSSVLIFALGGRDNIKVPRDVGVPVAIVQGQATVNGLMPDAVGDTIQGFVSIQSGSGLNVNPLSYQYRGFYPGTIGRIQAAQLHFAESTLISNSYRPTSLALNALSSSQGHVRLDVAGWFPFSRSSLGRDFSVLSFISPSAINGMEWTAVPAQYSHNWLSPKKRVPRMVWEQ